MLYLTQFLNEKVKMSNVNEKGDVL